MFLFSYFFKQLLLISSSNNISDSANEKTNTVPQVNKGLYKLTISVSV